ncbi:sensor histidine kinase [Vacuolonema iberomarrocanum]|uniref:sensor histidine kinase n=1 Tax=Vacuolonema iberomarrocanum TaxID=3454632 RepID=UPI0019DC61E6|nr:sensor histidine kinase [filamentous cyanobacterium LEGE 07170]
MARTGGRKEGRISGGVISDRPITPQNHPFPFLLYAEWGLLAIALLSDFLLPRPPRFAPVFPIFKLLSITGFGLMGLRLPTRLAIAIPYTLLEFGWLFLATSTSGRRLHLFPLLYIVLVIRSCLMFRLPGRIFVTVAAFCSFLLLGFMRMRLSDFVASPALRDRLRPVFFATTLNTLLVFGLALLFVLFLVNALMAERASRQRLTEANRQLRDYALRVENLAMEQERNRIARDIHDSLGHSLTALNLQLETALKLFNHQPDKAQQFLQEAKKLGSTALQDVRQSVAAMRTDPLQQSLEAAIAALLQDFTTTTGIQPITSIQLSRPLPPDVRTSLYRILQEALTNITKHAYATETRLSLHTLPEAIALQISDNGNGFHPTQNSSGFGLQGIRERTHALGGTLIIHSAPNQGTTLDITLPYM